MSGPSLRNCAAVIGSLALATPACSKPEPPPPPAPTEPWPAQPTSSASGLSRTVRFAVAARGTAGFVLKTRRRTIEGEVRVAKGELEIDLMQLDSSTGMVHMDVASAVVFDEDGEIDRQASARARNWLDVGSSQPESTRDRHRWARFEISGFEEVATAAAHAGKRRRPDPPPDAGAGGSGSVSGEIRVVRARARGALTFHGYRVEQRVPVELHFHYPVAATPGARPERLELRSRSTFPISLAAHDIRPRDPRGVLIAEDMKLLGREVGREARVSVRLAATPMGD